MKDEVNTILNYLDGENVMVLLRNQLLSSSASRPAELAQTVASLRDAIKQTNIQSHKYAGYYYLFLGCAYYEQDQYKNAVSSLQSAVSELWGSQVNKALARWLIGLCHANMQDFPKARNELQEALQLLATHIGNNSPRTDKEYRSRQTIRQNIKDAHDRLFNEPLFRNVLPDPAQSADRFPVQDPPTDEKDAFPTSFNMPISVTNENYPTINVPVNVNNENSPVNKISFQPPSPNPEPKTAKAEQQQEYEPERPHETRTDDDGYLVIRSIPVYNKFARAGNEKGSKPEISQGQAAEFHQVSIDGKIYSIHSLKSNTKQVNVNQDGMWGWIKVKGQSMNAMKGNVSINDGDYILFQYNSNANDNDIVIATRKDANISTQDASTHVKRFRKLENMFYSESTETGPNYEPIDMKASNMKIIGIVYWIA
ncbi:MAG: hypothetical protein IPL71_15545 [Anaerolineales bacterium]|uniref:S24 family peptidase n=1 Tax=Candidatus Villigracilis proximus TaxID=3140683 RepID=UPI00313548F0|nr:hypothetical protein [Anaerolineales bacterium]